MNYKILLISIIFLRSDIFSMQHKFQKDPSSILFTLSEEKKTCKYVVELYEQNRHENKFLGDYIYDTGHISKYLKSTIWFKYY